MRAFLATLPVVVASWSVAAPADCDRIHEDRFEGGPCSEVFNVDVSVVTQDIVFTMNGDPPPASALENGEITLRNPDSGDVVLVGQSDAGNGEYSIRVIAGTYQAYWSLLNGGTVVPANQPGRLGEVIIDGSGPIAIDMTRVDTAGDITLDGGAPPTSEFESADIYLRNFAAGEAVWLGNTSDGGFSRLTVPGTYDIVYELSQGGLVIPLNRQGVVGTVAVPDETEIIIPLDVELRSGTISGDLRFNGQLPPDSLDDSGRIFFVDRVTGDDIQMGDTANGQYFARLLTGRYDVHYRAGTPGAVAAVNTDHRLIADYEVVEGSQTLDLDIPVVDLGLTVTINGEPPPASVYEDGWIILRDDATGDEAPIGRSSENGGLLSARVIPGEYAVYWDLDSGGATVPVNRRALIETVQVQFASPLAVDVPMVELGGAFLLNGKTPPVSNFESAEIRLVEPATGDEVPLGETADSDYLHNVFAGNYRIDYRLSAGGGQVPPNEHAQFGQVCVPSAESAQRDIHIRSTFIAGGFFFNGVAPPASVFETGRILLVDPVTGGELLLGNTHDLSFNREVLIGRYDVYYSLENGGSVAPRNSRAHVGTFYICP